VIFVNPSEMFNFPNPCSHLEQWPWVEGSPDVGEEERPFSGGTWPKIIVVTPSYNQGEFIEETTSSIL